MKTKTKQRNQNWINLKVKAIRSKIIKRHLNSIGINKCVCFTCGNAARFLRREGLEVIGVGRNQKLLPAKWFGFTEIAQQFNGLFDATSGHLPLPLLTEIAQELRKEIKHWRGQKTILTGSGETFVVLSLAFPNIKFTPIRDGKAETKFNKKAPLNTLVKILSKNNA